MNFSRLSKKLGTLAASTVVALAMMMAGNAKGQTTGDYNGLLWSSDGNTVKITGYDSSLSGFVAIPSTITNLPVTSIGVQAFMNCTKMTGVTIPNSIISIGSLAFAESGLTSITIPNSITDIADGVFDSCPNLTSVTIPNSVTSIEIYAFLGCPKLVNLTIGTGVTHIGNEVFGYCTALTSVTIPNVTVMDPNVFCNCTGLKSVTIGNGTTVIGNYTFGVCTSLTRVTIGSGVTSIGSAAFDGCSSLTSITIPSGVTSVGQAAFIGCSSLTNVCFEGNAPTDGGIIFNYDYALRAVQFINGTTGWISTFSGVPTTPCVECGIPISAAITPLRVTYYQAMAALNPANVNVPIVPTTFDNILGSTRCRVPLGVGVVADGVTPVLFMINGTPGTYSLGLTTLDASSSGNVTYTGGSLANNLYVLDDSGWTQSTSLTIHPDATGTNGTAYAYLQGMNWSGFSGVNPPANQVNATLSLNTSDGSQQVTSTNFGIRPLPIVLVHGVADTGATWSYDFTNALAQNVPADFIQTITYGQGTGTSLFARQHWPSCTSSLTDLAKEVDTDLHNVETQISSNWDFTRYDAVGHSQGGVLLRMLCQTAGPSGYGVFTSDQVPVVSGNNFYRGRFRRIVTIGSPQNGSLIGYYLDQMPTSIYPWNNLYFSCIDLAAPAIQKFDPAKSQIQSINSGAFSVDSRIGFHCIQATINGGLPPVANESQNPPIYNAYRLQYKLSSGQTRGQVLIPFGSDGVVDTVSQGGGSGTPQGKDFTYVAHAVGGAWFGVLTTNDTETADEFVGIDVANLLSGPDSKFGPFVLPQPITQSALNTYNSLVPSVHTIVGAIVQLFSPMDASTNINYVLNVPSNLPLEGGVNWQALVYDTNGIDTNGVSAQVNTNNTTLMTLSVAGNVVGQVVISAEYMTTNGDLVFAAPVVAESVPPAFGATLTNIELVPPAIALNVGETIPSQIWGDYSGGLRSLLYTPPGQVAYVSSNPQIASADAYGNVTLNSQGAASIKATYSGFSAQTVVSTVAPMIPRVLFAGETNGTFGFSIFGSTGITNIVQASTNLVNWVPLATLLPTNGLTQFFDSNASSFPYRFYRVMIPAISTNISTP